jgi:hypothetical protein
MSCTARCARSWTIRCWHSRGMNAHTCLGETPDRSRSDSGAIQSPPRKQPSRRTVLAIIRATGRFGKGGGVSRSWPAPILVDSFEELHDVAEAIEMEQVWRIRRLLRCRGTGVISQVHGDGSVGAIWQPHDQVRIHSLAEAYDGHLLTIEGMMRMGNSYRFRSWLGRLGSVLGGCRLGQTNWCRK